MTTCAECLTSLSTMRLSDLSPDSAVALHCASCPDCASVLQETMYAEKRLSNSLADLRPGLPPERIYSGALEASERIRREEIARWVRWFLGAAAAATLLWFTRDVIIPRIPASRLQTETITVKCITPEQASEIATPYLRARGSAIYQAKGLRTLTIRGRPDEYVAAVNEIQQIDDAAHCSIPGPAAAPPATTPTSSGTPGKD